MMNIVFDSEPTGAAVKAWADREGIPCGVRPTLALKAAFKVANPDYVREHANIPFEMNGEGCWIGRRGDREFEMSLNGVPLVYLLVNDSNVVLYVGSTSMLGSRLMQRYARVSGASRWVAWPFPTRHDAYLAEAQWVCDHMPGQAVVAVPGVKARRAPGGKGRLLPPDHKGYPFPADQFDRADGRLIWRGAVKT